MVGERTWGHIEVNVGDIEDKLSHSVGSGMQVSPVTNYKALQIMIFSSGERHSAGALGCFVTSLQGIVVWKSSFSFSKFRFAFPSLLVKFLKSCNTFPFSTQLTVNTLPSEGN